MSTMFDEKRERIRMMNEKTRDGGETLEDAISRKDISPGQVITLRFIPEFKDVADLRTFAVVVVASVVERAPGVFAITATTRSTGSAVVFDAWRGAIAGTTGNRTIPLMVEPVLCRIHG